MIKSTYARSPPCPLNHSTKCQSFLDHLQRWWFHHLTGQSVQMLNHLFHEQIFPDVQPQPPLEKIEALSSHPVTSCLWEEADSHQGTGSGQAVVKSPLNLLISWLNTSSSVSYSSYNLGSRPSSASLPITPIYFLLWGAQNWTQSSRCSFTSDDYRGKHYVWRYWPGTSL